MSQMRITIPITVNELNSSPASVTAVSDRDAVKNPDTAQFRYTHPKSNSHGPFNPWRLRDDFLSWPLEDWDAFFYMAGKFGGVRITKKDFEEWQRLMKRALLIPSNEWKTLSGEFDSKKVATLRASLPIHFNWDTEPPTATLLGLNSLTSMIAAIQVDKLQGAQFRLCARPDCHEPPFKVGTRQKIYCDGACAHLAAVRAKRARDAESIDPVIRNARGRASRRKDNK